MIYNGLVRSDSCLQGDGDESWRPQKIRLLEGTTFCMSSDGMDVDDGGGVADAGSGRGEERFNVLAAEAERGADTPEASSLLRLRTDRGRVEVSLPEKEDRDSILVGLGLLLQASATKMTGNFSECEIVQLASEKRSAKSRGKFSSEGDRSSGRGGLGRGNSRRWEVSEGQGGGSGMVLESADDETEDENRDDGPPPAMASLRHEGWEEVR